MARSRPRPPDAHLVTPAGRRPGPTTSDAAILAAARERFGRLGYRGTTIRAVAEDAGVNQALVRHFFGSKQQLFMAALEFPAEPLHHVLEVLGSSPADELGRRLTTVFVRAWRDPATSPQLRAVFRSASVDPEGATMVRQLVEEVVVPTVVGRLGAEAENVMAALAQLLGYSFLASIVGVQPLVEMEEEAVVGLIGPTVQRYLEG